MIKLGSKARDKVTGFTGIITGRAQWLTGCDQYSLAPSADGAKLEESRWFDEGRIEVVGKGVSVADVTVGRAGGPKRELPTKST